METKEIPTRDDICATFAEVRDQIQLSHICLDATIDDYPIGRRDRGKCRLQVERAKNNALLGVSWGSDLISSPGGQT